MEWEREVEVSGEPPANVADERGPEELPFGLRVAADCQHLEDDPLEMRTLRYLAELIVQDVSFRSLADALNAGEYRTRDGRPWNATSVFILLQPASSKSARAFSSAPNGSPARRNSPASPGTPDALHPLPHRRALVGAGLQTGPRIGKTQASTAADFWGVVAEQPSVTTLSSHEIKGAATHWFRGCGL